MCIQHGLLDEMLGGGIELLIIFFPSDQIERIMRCKAIFMTLHKCVEELEI
jgi:hypothetical protein